MVFLHGVFVLLSLALTGSSGCDTGLKFKKGQFIYNSKVTKDEAEKLRNYLFREDFFAEMKVPAVQLTKSGPTYQFRMVVLKGRDKEQGYIAVCKRLAGELSKNVFNGQKIEIHLCDDYLKTLRVVTIP
jgi:hypothetical protein